MTREQELNPNIEIRNPKQIQNTNIKMTKIHRFEHSDFHI
jgi:hypothetical protein